jgi:hypothetical protein
MKELIALSVLICLPVFAQPKQTAEVGGGHIPARGPVPAKPCTAAQASRPTAFTVNNVMTVDQPGHPNVPHVDANNDKWVGDDTCANDPHYHLDHPWAHGRFTGGLGPQQVFVLSFDKLAPGVAEWLAKGLNRVSFADSYWNVAGYNLYNIAGRWKFNGDQVVVYQDPVHAGWYLAYSPQSGTYAHVEYLGKVVNGIPGPDTDQTEMKGEFENDQVIINQPHPKMHVDKYNCVIIYAFRGGELVHYLDGHTEDLHWQAGQVRWSPASGLHYSGPSPTAVFHDPPPPNGVMGMDIGIKKPGNPGKVVRTALDPLRVDPQDYRLEFENSQVRVMRVKMGRRQSVPMHEFVLNRVVFYLTDENLRQTSPDGKAVAAWHKAGDYSWDGPAKYKIENLDDKPFEALVVEVKN